MIDACRERLPGELLQDFASDRIISITHDLVYSVVAKQTFLRFFVFFHRAMEVQVVAGQVREDAHNEMHSMHALQGQRVG